MNRRGLDVMNMTQTQGFVHTHTSWNASLYAHTHFMECFSLRSHTLHGMLLFTKCSHTLHGMILFTKCSHTHFMECFSLVNAHIHTSWNARHFEPPPPACFCGENQAPNQRCDPFHWLPTPFLRILMYIQTRKFGVAHIRHRSNVVFALRAATGCQLRFCEF
jgi:hypothetical protein